MSVKINDIFFIYILLIKIYAFVLFMINILNEIFLHYKTIKIFSGYFIFHNKLSKVLWINTPNYTRSSLLSFPKISGFYGRHKSLQSLQYSVMNVELLYCDRMICVPKRCWFSWIDSRILLLLDVPKESWKWIIFLDTLQNSTCRNSAKVDNVCESINGLLTKCMNSILGNITTSNITAWQTVDCMWSI